MLNVAAKKKSRSQSKTAEAGDLLRPVTIQEMTRNRRKDRIHRKHHRENTRRRPAAPVKRIQQSDIKNAERRMQAAGKAENDKRNCGNQPGCWKKASRKQAFCLAESPDIHKQGGCMEDMSFFLG